MSRRRSKHIYEWQARLVAIQLAAHLVQHITDMLNLVRNLGAAKDSQEWSLGVFKDLRKELECLLHQGASHTLLQLHVDHTRVRPVSGSERVVDIHIAEFGERLAERLDGGGIGFDLVCLLILDRTFLFDVEPQVLGEDW